MSRPLLLGSLFAGIGGLELGLGAALHEAGIPHRVGWQVELDPFCRAILARHWPEADRSVVDVRAASSLPRVDLLCGGFPCQDVSSAGRGEGLGGARSGLWFAMRDVIAALRPTLVVAENVASGKRRYLCRVRSDLHALGYRTTAYQLGAHDVGAPHRRERIFIVAYASGGGQRPGSSTYARGNLTLTGAIRVEDLCDPGAAERARRAGAGGRQLRNEVGRLSAEWVEALMGFPPGWTSLPDGLPAVARPKSHGSRRAPSPEPNPTAGPGSAPSATPSSRSKRGRSGG